MNNLMSVMFALAFSLPFLPFESSAQACTELGCAAGQEPIPGTNLCAIEVVGEPVGQCATSGYSLFEDEDGNTRCRRTDEAYYQPEYNCNDLNGSLGPNEPDYSLATYHQSVDDEYCPGDPDPQPTSHCVENPNLPGCGGDGYETDIKEYRRCVQHLSQNPVLVEGIGSGCSWDEASNKFRCRAECSSEAQEDGFEQSSSDGLCRKTNRVCAAEVMGCLGSYQLMGHVCYHIQEATMVCQSGRRYNGKCYRTENKVCVNSNNDNDNRGTTVEAL